MGKQFTKDIGEPGRFFTETAVIDVSTSDYDEFLSAWTDMNETGLDVPVHWGHPAVDDPTGWPYKREDTAERERRDRDRLQIGEVKEFFKDDKGNLSVRFDAPRDDDADKLEKIGRKLSPQFGPYTNPISGKKYEKAITHIAVTPRPVNPNQSKEFLAATAMSLDAALAKGAIQTVQLGDSPYEEVQTDDPYSDDYNKPEADDEKKPGEKKPTTLQRLIECLAKGHNIVLPDGWSWAAKNAPKILLAATESSAAAEQNTGGQRQDQPENRDQNSDRSLRTEPTVLVMSQDAAAKLDAMVASGKMAADKAKKIKETPELIEAFQLSLDGNEPEVKPVEPVQMSQPTAMEIAMREQLTEMCQEKYLARIGNAERSGRVSPANSAKLRDLAKTFQFSAESKSNALLDAKLEIIESMPAGAVWDDKQKITQMASDRGKLEVEPQPGFFTGGGVVPESEEEQNSIVDAELKAMGLA
jgi:hypothetical protein